MSKLNKIIVGVLLITALFLLVKFVDMRMSISETTQKIASVQEKIDEQKIKNSELEDLLAEENRDDFYKNIAEDELGYGLSNEKIYKDIAEN